MPRILQDKGPLGNADPRVEAIQILKGLNRAIYYSGTEVQPAFGRIRRWFLGSGLLVAEQLTVGPVILSLYAFCPQRPVA